MVNPRSAPDSTFKVPDTLHQSRGAATRATWMATALAAMGILHFLKPEPFDSLVPKELPGSPRIYTYASGATELTVAGLLAAPVTRRHGGLAAAILFACVFPANINMVRLWQNKPLPLRAIAVARLPLQIPMITSAIKVWRAERPGRQDQPSEKTE